jgi:hypothetical protein
MPGTGLADRSEGCRAQNRCRFNNFDNVYYEVCNEPYGAAPDQRMEHQTTAWWKPRFRKDISLLKFPPSDSPIADLNPHVRSSTHAAKPDAVRLNYPESHCFR